VATDLLERVGFPTSRFGEEWSAENDPHLESLLSARERITNRLAGIAQRLAEAGDIDRAFALDGKVDALSTGRAMSAYMPGMGEFRTREDVVLIGPRSLDWVRDQIAWLVDQVRPSPVLVNEFGRPTSSAAPEPTIYRWGRLLVDSDDPSHAWDQRFAAGSWLRRIFDTASKELPRMFGIEASGTAL
jgi:hypothetical protein